jgi:acetyltransferase
MRTLNFETMIDGFENNWECRSDYPSQYETWAHLKGLEIFFRPIKKTDGELLKELFRSHSQETIVRRYFLPLRELSPEMVTKFVDLCYTRDMAIIGLVPYLGRERMIGVGRFFRNTPQDGAEIALTVHDDYRRRGIGSYLLRELIRVAQDMEIVFLTADVLAGNHAMMALLHKCSPNLEMTLDAGVYHVVFPVRARTSINAKSLPRFGKHGTAPETNV